MNRNFPDLLEAYIDFTSTHESTKKIRCWSFISVIAAAMERKVWMDRGFYTLFANLYIFIIGKSGLIKKSTSTAIAVNLLRDLEKVHVMSERITAAALIGQMSRCRSPFEYENETIKQSPVFIYASELAVFLGEVYGSIIELLTTFFDCVPNDSNKPWVHLTKHSGEDRIFGPCLNILGASTVPWLRKNIPETELEGGFASRILFVVENDGPDKFVAWPTLGKDNLAKKTLILEDMDQITNLIGEIKVSENAKEFYTEWYERHMGQKDKKWTAEKFCGYMGRKGDHILKIAMVRSVCLSNELIMTTAHIKWAIAMLDAIEPDMFTIFTYSKNEFKRGSNGKELFNLGYSLHKFITDSDGADLMQLIRAFKQHATSEQIQAEILEMVDRRMIEKHEVDGSIVYTHEGLKPKAKNDA